MLVLQMRENVTAVVENKEGEKIEIFCKKGSGSKQLQLYIKAPKSFLIKRVDELKDSDKNNGQVNTNNERPINEFTPTTDKLYKATLAHYHKQKKST